MNFIEFAFGCPKVKKIQIKKFSENANFDIEDFKNFLTEVENLETFEILGNFHAKEEFFDAIIEIESNLKNLFFDIPIDEVKFEIGEKLKSLSDLGIKVKVPKYAEFVRENWEYELQHGKIECDSSEFDSSFESVSTDFGTISKNSDWASETGSSIFS